MLVPLKFRPGVVRDTTFYSNEGGWYDCDKVRFRMGLPEKMGGWVKRISESFIGICRAMINWTVLSGVEYIGIGTNAKYYVTTGEEYIDVTPLRRTVTLGANPFAATAGSDLLLVTDVGHGAEEGSYVTFSGATAFDNFTADDLNQEFEIDSVVDANTYYIDTGIAAAAAVSGGGAAVEAQYQINIGLATAELAFGWGTGSWGLGPWGGPSSSGVYLSPRLWGHDTFGEDLIAVVRNSNIYYWDATIPNARMVALSTLGGASDVPTIATAVLVSAEGRHAIAFGCTPLGSTTQDPLLVRWSTSESAVNWTPAVTNTAGDYRLSIGTFIVAVAHTRSEILIWTDLALYSMRYIGGQFVFSFTLVGTGTNIMAPNANVSINDVCIWMGRDEMYMYDGRLQSLECPVTDYIFTRFNQPQRDKVYGFTNSVFNEVGWFYPSTTDECDSYVMYNYKEKAWYYGSMPRTAWLDRGPAYFPLATSSDRILYEQEVGFDDGSTTPASAITAYIESSPMESPDGGKGEKFQFIDRLIPDVTFRDSSAASPSVSMTVKMQNYPGANYSQNNARTITQTATVPVDQYTEQVFIRLRGRSAVFRCESSGAGVTWRLGTPRIGVRPDGRR